MKKKLILFQVFIAIILICTNVYAAVSATLQLEASSTELKPGDTVNVTLSVKDIAGTDKGITDIVGYIKYNNNIFENITIDNIVKNNDGKVVIGNNTLTIGSDGNSDVLFNANTGKILIEALGNPIKVDTTILTIRFVVKNSATIGAINDAISFEVEDLFAEWEEVLVDSSVSVNLEIQNPSNPDPDQNTNTNNDNTNTNTNSNTNTNTNTNTNRNTNTNSNTNTNTNSNTNNANTNANTNKSTNTNTNIDNTVATSALPATGIRAIIFPIIVLIILAYVSYNRYIKYKEV